MLTQKCPRCGASVKHAADATMVTCHYCGAELEVGHPKRAVLDDPQDEPPPRSRRKPEGTNAGCFFMVGIFGLIGAIMGGIYYVENYVTPWQWDGHKSFSCNKGSGTFTKIQATGSVEAKGYCTIELINPQIEAQVTASDHGTVHIIGGRVHYKGTAVTAKGFGKVILEGTTVDGQEAIRAKDSAVVESKGAIIIGAVNVDHANNLVGAPMPSATSTSKKR